MFELFNDFKYFDEITRRSWGLLPRPFEGYFNYDSAAIFDYLCEG